METLEELISDKQIISAWGNAVFGNSITKREIIANALLKYAIGYSTGSTIRNICFDLRLINIKRELTILGRQYLFTACSNGISI